MKWLRLYYEFASDPKIQSMDETLQRRYIMLLLLQGNGDLEKVDDDELASALRITPEELEKTREIFEKKNFINGSWCLRAFSDRQFQSDDSKERVDRYRKKMKRDSNGVVTSQDTDTDNIYKGKPKEKKNKTTIFKKPTITEIKEYADGIGYNLDAEKFFYSYEQKNWMVGKNKMKNWKAAIVNWKTNKWGEIEPKEKRKVAL